MTEGQKLGSPKPTEIRTRFFFEEGSVLVIGVYDAICHDDPEGVRITGTCVSCSAKLPTMVLDDDAEGETDTECRECGAIPEAMWL